VTAEFAVRVAAGESALPWYTVVPRPRDEGLAIAAVCLSVGIRLCNADVLWLGEETCLRQGYGTRSASSGDIMPASLPAVPAESSIDCR